MAKRTTKRASGSGAAVKSKGHRPGRVATAARAAAPVGEAFAVEAARLLSDDKCTDVVVLDVRGLSQVTDFLVIGSGTSDRQMHSVMMHVEELGQKQGQRLFRSNRDERATWLLADFSDVIVHLFEPNTRAHYDLEMLWGDAKRPAWERRGRDSRNRAGLTDADAALHRQPG